MNGMLSLSLSIWSPAVMDGLRPPAGYRFVVDEAGRLLVDDTGRYIIMEI